MDLALNNLQRFICHKIQPTNQPTMVFHSSLSNSMSLQVSSTLLSILADLNNVVIWMVSTRPLISKLSSPWFGPLVIVTKATTTIVPRRTIHVLLGSRKRLLLFVQLVFSSPYLGRLWVYSFWGRFILRRSFRINVDFPLAIPSGASASCRHVHFECKSVLDGGEFFEPESMAWLFLIWYLFVLFWINLCVFSLSVLHLVLHILFSYS